MGKGQHIALIDIAYTDGHFDEESEWKVVELPCKGNVEEIIRFDESPRRFALRMNDGHYFKSEDFGDTWIGPLNQLDQGIIQLCPD